MNKIIKLIIALSVFTISIFADVEADMQTLEMNTTDIQTSELKKPEIAWEVGFGTNYGGLLGITANYIVAEDVEVYGGLAILGGVVGARYYLDENIRFNANYGVNGYGYASDSSEDKLTIYAGLNLGIDYIFDNGVSLGIMTTLTSKNIYGDGIDDKNIDINKDIDDYTPNVFISVGYRF